MFDTIIGCPEINTKCGTIVGFFEEKRPEAEQALTMQGASSEASPAPKKAEKKPSAKKTKK